MKHSCDCHAGRRVAHHLRQRSVRPSLLDWSAAARTVSVVCVKVIELSDGGGDAFDQSGLTLQPCFARTAIMCRAAGAATLQLGVVGLEPRHRRLQVGGHDADDVSERARDVLAAA
eukprot:7384363-Prymnesium_polylepis.3